jgi:hypothetical protein
LPGKSGGDGIIPVRKSAADTFTGVKWIGTVHSDHHKPWVSPVAKNAPRLYFASDPGTGDVYIYSLPSFRLVGTLSGFAEPQGECTDNQGNVFIADTNAHHVLKYSRTGTRLATYTDPDGYPVGCAWDPTTGNLAVTNLFNVVYPYSGAVLIYTSPSAKPTQIRNPQQYYYYYPGYDSSGNLWVDGRESKGGFILSGCGASSCSTISLSGGTIYFPGNVQWDGTRGTWVVFDQLCGNTTGSCSYPVSASGVLGAQTVYDTYDGNNVCDLIQGVIAANGKKYVVGGDDESCGKTSSTVNRWPYTGQGATVTPTSYTSVSGLYAQPNGAAISTK